jgi:hypothetical protein
MSNKFEYELECHRNITSDAVEEEWILTEKEYDSGKIVYRHFYANSKSELIERITGMLEALNKPLKDECLND